MTAGSEKAESFRSYLKLDFYQGSESRVKEAN